MYRRRVLVHYHIFKNAGSSVDAILSQGLGSKWRTFDGANPRSVLWPEDVQAFLQEHSEVEAVSSHHARPFLDDRTWEEYPIFLVRDPIIRVVSVFQFERRQGGVSPGSRMAMAGTLREYIEWRLGEDGGDVIRDCQARVLSSRLLRRRDGDDAVAPERILKEAKDVLESLPAFGLVERFEESAERFGKWLTPKFPTLEWRARRENASANPAGSRAAASEWLRRELGLDLFNRLLDANRLDIDLYDHATRVFDLKG
jgi:hypothetical protein